MNATTTRRSDVYYVGHDMGWDEGRRCDPLGDIEAHLGRVLVGVDRGEALAGFVAGGKARSKWEGPNRR